MSRITIIEDDPLMRSLLAEWLAADGYTVSVVERGCVDAADPADLVIVDVYMPRVLGFEQLRGTRLAHPHARIMAISGQFSPGVAAACAPARALGADRLMGKPFDRETLLDAVHALIGPPASAARPRSARD